MRAVVSGLAVLVAAASISTFGVAHAATTALIMGASGISDPQTYPAYMPNVERYYISPNSTCQIGTCTLVPVITPEGLLPPLLGNMTFDPSVAEGVDDITTALHSQFAAHPTDNVVVFGYSQSSDISTILKSRLNSDPQAPPSDQLSFVLTANTNRPNGGLFTRFPGVHIPLLNITFNPPPTPTDTGYATTDIAYQYDPIADFPRYPLNLLADLNAVMALPGVHLSYPNPYLSSSVFVPSRLPYGYTEAQVQQLMSDPANRQTYGDTTYITIPANNLPLLQPLIDFGTVTRLSLLTTPIVDLLQPALRVLIELGYDRTTPYGTPTTAGLFPAVTPGEVVANLGAAIKEGVQAAVNDIATRASSPTTSLLTAERSQSPSVSSLRHARAGSLPASAAASRWGGADGLGSGPRRAGAPARGALGVGSGGAAAITADGSVGSAAAGPTARTA